MDSPCAILIAAVFSTISDDDIVYVQNFIRNDLYEMLEKKSIENGTEYDDKFNPLFYGNYSSMKDKFEFSRGDIRQIKIMAAFVKSKVCDVEGNFVDVEHYSPDNKSMKKLLVKWQSKLSVCAAGLFFGNTLCNELLQTEAIQKEIYVAALIEKCNETFKQYESLSIVRPFADDMVSVEIDESNAIKGSVQCIFCDPLSSVSNIKLFFQASSKFGYWIPSNLNKHISIYHDESKGTKRKQAKKSTNKKSANNKLPKLKKQSIISINESQPEMEPNENVTPKTPRNRSTKRILSPLSSNSNNVKETLVSLKIEPFSLNSTIETTTDILYEQLSTQNIEMTSKTIKYKEKVVDFFVTYDLATNSMSDQVRVCRISGDGGCLFGSIAHQLFSVKINSAMYNKFTTKLRQDVVQHIRSNLNDFKHHLKGRIYEIYEKKEKQVERINLENLDHECEKFLIELSKPNFWGGTESFKAISQIYSINIIVVRDNGICNMVETFNENFHKSVAISYRNGNHYDSIVDMNEATILKYAKSISSQHQKHLLKILKPKDIQEI